MSNKKECYICHTTINLHKHHIYAGAFRKKSEDWGCWCYLCAKHHNMSGLQSVHGNPKLNRKLRLECEIKFKEKYNEELYMKVFKKSYED